LCTNPIEVRDGRTPPFFFIDNYVIDDCLESIGVIGLAVYCLLQRHGNRTTRLDVITRLKLRRNELEAAFERLVNAGLLAEEERSTISTI
jgi:hypothetical protein